MLTVGLPAGDGQRQPPRPAGLANRVPDVKNETPCAPSALVVAALLLLMAVLAGGAALRESVTVDEVAHVGAGVSYLQKLDLRMNTEHPPLAKILAALPLVARGVRTDYSHYSWTYSASGFNAMLGQWSFGHSLITAWNEPRETMAWARVPMLLLTLALGLLIYAYALRLADVWGARLCLALFVSTPAFLAFGPLVLTDIAVTFFSLLTMWTLANLWQSPTRARTASFGLALAGALLSKFSAGLLLVACVAFAASLRWSPLDGFPRRSRWRSTAKGVLGAVVVVYTAYLILSWSQPTTGLEALGHSPAALVLRRLLMPLLLYGTGLTFFIVTASRPTFILGHAYPHAVWFYFPAVFLLKSTLAFLGLLALGLVVRMAARRRLGGHGVAIRKTMVFHWRALWLFLLVFVAASLLSPMDLSIRHFTVPLVLLILLLSPLPGLLDSLQMAGWRPARACRWLMLVLAGASLVTAVRAYPYYIPFLNSLSMGHPGYELVNDSNLDWNQSLPDVQGFVERRGLRSVLIDIYGFSEPAVYVPRARFWNCQQPAPSDAGQWAVVSANMILESHNCAWLLGYPHEVLAGGSMYAFELPAAIPAAGDPGGPPRREDYHNLTGNPGSWPDFRLIFLRGIRDPHQLPAAMDELLALVGRKK